MGRPLKETVLEKMNLKVITADKDGEEGATKIVTLGKQVGYNKYIVKGANEDEDKKNIEDRKIVRLSNELVYPEDATMKLIHGDKEEFVLKITKNVFQTQTCVHPYELEVSIVEDETTHEKTEVYSIKFLETGVSLENVDS